MNDVTKTTPQHPEHIAALEAVLADLISVHEELLELVRDHRRAISRSDAAAIQECLSRQGMLGVQIAALEHHRVEVTASFGVGPRFADIAAVLPRADRDRVASQADRLRALLFEIQRNNGIVRAAAHSLMSHIDGLMQQVARALSRAGTYGRLGRVDGGPVACGLDMLH